MVWTQGAYEPRKKCKVYQIQDKIMNMNKARSVFQYKVGWRSLLYAYSCVEIVSKLV